MNNIRDISEQDVFRVSSLFDFLKRLSEDGVTSLIEKQVKSMLDHSLEFFTHIIMESCFPKIIRLTINKNVLSENKRIS